MTEGFDIELRKRFWAEIDMDAARENFLHIRSRLPKNTRLCCVVKANAYGHGALYLSRLYEELGAELFAVSNIEEAMQLRKGGIKGQILILGYTPAECAKYLLEYGLTQTVYSYDYFLYVTLVGTSSVSYASLEVDGEISDDRSSISLDLPAVDGFNYVGFGLWTYNDNGNKVAVGSRSYPTMFPMGPIVFKKQSL